MKSILGKLHYKNSYSNNTSINVTTNTQVTCLRCCCFQCTVCSVLVLELEYSSSFIIQVLGQQSTCTLTVLALKSCLPVIKIWGKWVSQWDYT